jgi:hypothetical protein
MAYRGREGEKGNIVRRGAEGILAGGVGKGGRIIE